MNIDYRQAEKTDIDFLIDLRKRTMDPHLQNSGRATDRKSHLDRILYRFDAAKIISINNNDVGLLKSYRDEKIGWIIVQLQISPDHQNKGIASIIVSSIINQAANEGGNVILNVLKSNPAKNLYKRLGFLIASENDDEYTMQILLNK